MHFDRKTKNIQGFFNDFTSLFFQGNFYKIMASVAIALLFVLLDQELNSAYIWQLELLSNCPEPYCRPLAKCFVTPSIYRGQMDNKVPDNETNRD